MSLIPSIHSSFFPSFLLYFLPLFFSSLHSSILLSFLYYFLRSFFPSFVLFYLTYFHPSFIPLSFLCCLFPSFVLFQLTFFDPSFIPLLLSSHQLTYRCISRRRFKRKFFIQSTGCHESYRQASHWVFQRNSSIP